MARNQWTRREMLKAGATAMVLPALVPSSVLGRDGAPPSETVRVGVIGCGDRAMGIIPEGGDVKGFQVVACCDCQPGKAANLAKVHNAGRPWGLYEDFRAMIEKEKPDAVMIETTTHARAWIAILAMQAGMDVYIEKPMCLTIAEGRAMVQAARKLNRVTQVGTQQRSMPMNNWASDLVKNGTIGKQITAVAPDFFGPYRWKKNSPKDLKEPVEKWWDVWTNQAELRPYHPELHRGWTRWWDYDGGGLCFGVTGWGAHCCDQINRALGTDDTGPTEIVLEAGVANSVALCLEVAQSIPQGDMSNKDTGIRARGIQWLVSPRAKVAMKFAAGHQLKFHRDADYGPALGATFFGEKGQIAINRNKLDPQGLAQSKDNPGPNRRPDTAYHIENWIECVKSRKTCNADIEIGQRASTLCLLINIAREVGRVGEPLKWDPAAERFTNCDEGNKLLDRPRRKGYELPTV